MATIRVQSDGDPFPGKAGNPLVNDGSTRIFDDSSIIADQEHDFSIKYRGGSNTINPQVVDPDQPIGITTTGVVIYSPIASSAVLPVSTVSSVPGYNWNIIENNTEFFLDNAGGKPENGGEYRYRSSAFYKKALIDAGSSLTNLSTYYTGGLLHSDGHSKIVGFAFDGYPIYGPMGYTSAEDNTSAVVRMVSGYETRTVPLTNRLSDYSQIAAGRYIEDYVFTSSGTLDEFNGRYCVTPDYTNGTYAYFLTFSDSLFNTPAYPYVVGPRTKEQRIS